jgi:DNA-directed RNA polymerase specialized sigma24 family protein
MALDRDIEARLQRWAQYVTVGDGSGYAAINTLHEDWSPPTPGMTPTLKATSASDVRQTHRAIEQLSLRLRNTVAVHYCLRLPVDQQAERLDCSRSTVYLRIFEAQRQLRALLSRTFCNMD